MARVEDEEPYQGPHCTGKMVKKNPYGGGGGGHREFGNFAQTQGISFGHPVNFLILKIQDLAIFPQNFHFFKVILHLKFKLAQGYT